MALMDTISADLKTAMKARDEVGKRTLRMLKSELGKMEADLGRALEESDELAALSRGVKTRKEAIVEYDKAGRTELAADERAELEVLARYMPKALTEDEAREAIAALAKEHGITEKKQMGQLMKHVMANYRGQIDGKLASRIAGSLLS